MQKGGFQYGVPPSELPPFSNSRPAEPTSPAAARQQQQQLNFEEMAAAGAGLHEDDLLGGGEDADRGGISGNRWPRQETLALLKIRSDMDATFREASLKGPLWEEVSRKLAEQGYTRSAKKCKEKFENVHKYYKRTKDSRAARPDGKSYRFFSQLEALHNASSSSPAAAAAAAPAAVSAAAMPGGAKIPQPTPISSIPPAQTQSAVAPVAAVKSSAAMAAAVGLSGFSSGGASFSSNSSESETEDEESEEGAREQRKRKREEGGAPRGGGGGSRSMMAFFDELMKQVMERQEAMQQKFLETIEKREQDRMIREEAWRQQEMARLSREQEAMTHERTVVASRDATIISFLQKITGQTVQLPQSVSPPVPSQPQHPATPVAPPAPPPPPPPAPTPPPQPQPPPQVQPMQPPPPHVDQTLPPLPEIVPSTMHEHSRQIHETESHPGSTSDPASSRWPKTEVHALINIRAGMESRYQEAVPKGPLWEEISAAMKQIGYNRNAKRCKEKWENINKYFKKVKESNKKRPEDAKTCPYFHQLDALYRSKVLGGFGATSAGDHVQARMQQQDPDPTVLPITTLPPPSNGGDNSTSKTILGPIGGGGGAPQAAPNSNGGLSALHFSADAATTDLSMKKPEDIVKELMDRRQQQHQQYDYDRMDEDTDDDNDDEDDDMMDEEEQKMAYKIEFQRPTMPPTSTSNANGSNKASRSAGSFLAMVHQ